MGTREGGALMNRMNVSYKSNSQSSLACVRTQPEGAAYKPKSEPSPDHAITFTLDLPASRMVNNTFLLFMSYPACGIL